MKNNLYVVLLYGWIGIFGVLTSGRAQDSSSTDVVESPDSLENKTTKRVTQFQFAKPVKLTAKDGEPIDVTTGHAAPRVYDFDKDGIKDLLVGEFGDGTFSGESTVMKPESFCNARIRIYLNQGTDAKPVYDGFEYLKAGGKVASVPNF